MDKTELQQLQSKLAKEFPSADVIFLGFYEGKLTFSIDERPADDDDDDSSYKTGYPVYALVSPSDVDHYELLSDTRMKITDHFFYQDQDSSATDED